MARITVKETITKKIEIPIEALGDLIASLPTKDRAYLLERLSAAPPELKSFRKDKIEAILADFAETSLYEDGFLRDLAEGLRKSSPFK